MNKRRIITFALTALAVVLVGVVVMFAFGAPQSPVGRLQETASSSAVPPVVPAGALPGATADATTPTSGGAVESTRAGADDDVVPPPDPSSPFAIEIPGCVCHSDDPTIVQQHSEYRMNQCFGCHAGGMPEMGE
ncbi:MAG: hypothetical protein CVT60_03430 [Actinobacteria bacterium HGW-Actinobacteria-10]|nr:MAG: hypothetical protein CVT60_03430 [Actinobacteria bacterium HGW-Actinobacteria-10]